MLALRSALCPLSFFFSFTLFGDAHNDDEEEEDHAKGLPSLTY